MKKRLPYLAAASVLLLTEILIGAFAHDDFIRPYLGDVLVTPLLCCLIRCVFPTGLPLLPVGVFVFSVFVELFQLVDIPALEGTLLGIIVGTSFSWLDILCYAAGCALFTLVENLSSEKKSY